MADFEIDRTNSTYHLLCTCRIGALKARLPRSKDVSSVSQSARTTAEILLTRNSRPLSTFQSYYQRIIQNARNPSSLISQASNSLQQVRSLDTAKWVAGGVVLAEVLGFFTVGEMIGRMKLVGYRGEAGAHH